MNYIITQEQLNALLNYLITRPYSEVYQGIDMLKSLKAVEPQKPKSENDLTQEIL